MLILIWLRGLLGRRGGRLAAAGLGVAFAVALLAALGTFLGASKATMTQRAIGQVAVDWQVEAQPGADPSAVQSALRSDSRVTAAVPVGFAATTGLKASHGATTLTTGSGMVLGLPPGYQATFPGELRHLTGSADGVLLAQQTAANLHAAVGDTISIGRAGLAPVQVRVDGIVDLPQADSLFQRIGVIASAQPKAPPDNVLLLPMAQWRQFYGPLAGSRPDMVKTQVHARLRHDLPADPAAAFTAVTGAASNTEARLAGAGLVGDNLGAALGAARQDALYSQILFLFLGVPGAVLAAVLTVMIANSAAARRRREQALLRTRGATARQVLRLAAVEALVVGLGGVLAGLLLAAGIGQASFGSASFGATGATAAGWAVTAAFVGLLIAAAAVLHPGVAGPAGHHGDRGPPHPGTATAGVVDEVRRGPVAAARLGGGLLPHLQERLPAGPGPRGPADAVRQLLGLRRPRHVLGRGGAAVLAPGRPAAEPGPQRDGHAQPPAGREPVRNGRRQPVPAAPGDHPDSYPARPGHRLRGLHGDLRRHLPAAGPGGRPAHQRGGRDRHRIPRHARAPGPGPGHRQGTGGQLGRTAAAPIRLRGF